MIKTTLKISELNKKYDKFQLQDINLTLHEGEIVGLIGKNGAGKSTIIKCIMNLISYDNGIIKIGEYENNSSNEVKIKNYIGYVGDYLNFYPSIKIDSVYKFARNFYENWDEDLFLKLINKFNIDLSKKNNELSKGMVVKFSLALALAHKPHLLILDEPTSGLDPVIRNELLLILSDEAKKRKCSILFSSHITEDIIKIADNIVFINDGQIKLIDSKETILNNYLYSNVPKSNFSKYNSNIILGDENYIVINSINLPSDEIKNLITQHKFRNVKLDELLLAIIGNYTSK